MEISIIIPFCNEWPQVAFTIRNIAEELMDRADFEIIAVDNWCDELKAQGASPDRGHEHILSMSQGNEWLKVIAYDKKLSHWQAKNAGVEASTGKFLFFCDAHCIVARDALYNLYSTYRARHYDLNGTLHLPLTYHILEWHKLIYKPVIDLQKGELHYSFTRYRDKEEPYRVACMSTCGMMIERTLYDDLGGWPSELGIYGGGENFLNYSLATLGKTVNIMPGGALHHHGDKRGYSYNYNDYTRNRVIANYLVGGREMATRFIKNRKGSPDVLETILDDVITTTKTHRQWLKARQEISIQEWFEKDCKEDI